MRIAVQAKPDPNGRPVDVITWPQLINIAVLTGKYRRDEIQSSVAGALIAVRDSTAGRLRSRSFVIYLGETSTTDRSRVTVVALPYPVATDVFEIVHARLVASGVAGWSTSPPKDVFATPLFRYQAGRLISYYDPFEPRENPHPDAGFEVRGYRLRDRPAGHSGHRPALPWPSVRADARHTLASWSELRNDILAFTYAVRSPGTFSSLKERVRKAFGIEVRTRSATELPLFGAIETGWIVGEEPATTVRISVRADLSDRQKYVVLAHELAHYVLHFPMLMIAKMVEQAAWSDPGTEYAWYRLQSRVLGPLSTWIEPQATCLASNLILAPRFSPRALADVVFEKGRAVTREELAWRFLRSYFPETADRDYGWRNYDQMIEHMESDLNFVAGRDESNLDTLFYQFLAAVIDRESPDFQTRNHTLQFRLERLYAEMFQYMAAGPDRRPAPATTATIVPAADLTRAHYRRLYAPRTAGAGSGTAPRVPLVPAGRKRELWVDPRRPGAPADLETWRDRHPERATVVYPYADVPRATMWSLDDD
ncbi:hypothetical protein [Actinoplanes sp. NPDC051411]|uniref:ImmA/IrrE family metallo-endopeptidase n=1 Tax=Actinoplanes sp. NPDC051411 TaxID=3155522 RepID=UPI00344A055D